MSPPARRRPGDNLVDHAAHRWTAAELSELLYEAMSRDPRADDHTGSHLRAVADAAGIAGALVSLGAISRRPA